MKTDTILSTDRVSKIYNFGKEKIIVLANISMKIRKGSSIAIMGASGEGKTTLLHILGSLEKPTSGNLFFNDKDINSYDLAYLRSSSFGFIFQSYNLLDDLTVIENLILPLRIARKDVSKNKDEYNKAIKLLDEVQLSHRIQHRAKTLSGGEKQRLTLARAFANNPEIIFADEPSGNLDHKTSKSIHSLMLTSVKQKNKALIVVTHDKELADLCDECFLLKDGFLFPI